MKKKALTFAGATLLAFLGVGTTIDVLLPLRGLDRGLLWGGMALLGITGAVLVFLHFKPAKTEPVAKGPVDSEIDLPLTTAGKRLAASRVGGGRIGRVPVVLVMGRSGGGKTTAVLQSGIEPELLAGEAQRDATPPTRGLNIWYAQGAVVLEAGGAVLKDQAQWIKLLQRLRPTRLAAAFGRSRQAPRQVVVCVDCEELMQRAAEAPAGAQELRARLAELSQQLGIRVPVYVVFTKADRIPYFEDFVRNLTREEAQELLGVTLPLADSGAGMYAEAQSARIRDGFDGLFRSLADNRLRVLPRESREPARAGAYEFPREVLKLAETAKQYLLELCRPSQLGVTPVLRGFYFTGVRPIVVEQAAPQMPAAPSASRVDLGATGIFSIASNAPAAAPAAAAASSRRVPDWVFLRRLFPEIVLNDKAAKELTGGGVRVDFMRRGLIAASILFLLLLSAGFTVSYFGNRELAAEGVDAVRGVEPVEAAIGEAPALDDLQRLDSLRAVVERVGGYQREGRPWRLGWGLYTGNEMYPELRRAYFDRFDRLLWSGARADLLATLRGLQDAPRDAGEYGGAYDALKAHLITTSNPQESTPDFLTPVVLRHWRQTSQLDPAREELVRRQIDFFANELRIANPYADVPEEQAVLQSRNYLRQFTGTEPLYRALLAEASRGNESIQFNRDHPGSEVVVRNNVAIPGEFTRGGWAQAQAALSNIDQLLAREDWVVGERSVVAPADRARLEQELRTRYVTDYIGAWRSYLGGTTVASFAGPEDAARKLAVLSSNESPLLELFAVASRHTSVDTTAVASAFQPVHMVVPAGDSTVLVGESNTGYIGALSALQAAMAQVAEASGPARIDASAAASSNSEQVNLEVRNLAQSFILTGYAREVGLAVQRILQAPTSGARALAQGLPSAEVNAQGPAFCRPITLLAAKYPFNPRASVDATMEEVASVLQPGSSALWGFYDEALQDLLQRQGTRYAARPGADPAPTAAFVTSFNRLAEISSGLFPETGGGPRVSFTFRPQMSEAVPEVRFAVDAAPQTFTRTVAAAKTITWEGERARSARLSVRVGEADVAVAEATGPWALFRVMQAATWEQQQPGVYQLRWAIPSGTSALTAQVDFGRSSPILAPGYLSQLDCVSRIVR